MKEERGRGNKIITRMFLPDSTFLLLSIHQRKVTSVAHTLSLSPSLSLPLNPHTYAHHTHTFTQSKLGRYELMRFLEVVEIVFFRAELKVLIVVAVLMCSGSEFQTERPK